MFSLRPSLRRGGHRHRRAQVEQVQFPNYGAEVAGRVSGGALRRRTLRRGHGEAAGRCLLGLVRGKHLQHASPPPLRSRP